MGWFSNLAIDSRKNYCDVLPEKTEEPEMDELTGNQRFFIMICLPAANQNAT